MPAAPRLARWVMTAPRRGAAPCPSLSGSSLFSVRWQCSPEDALRESLHRAPQTRGPRTAPPASSSPSWCAAPALAGAKTVELQRAKSLTVPSLAEERPPVTPGPSSLAGHHQPQKPESEAPRQRDQASSVASSFAQLATRDRSRTGRRNVFLRSVHHRTVGTRRSSGGTLPNFTKNMDRIHPCRRARLRRSIPSRLSSSSGRMIGP
ncbi:MAG: hypothetical protein ACI9KE_003333 [Polyangiales bacterium]|jgi:hypothetical protein